MEEIAKKLGCKPDTKSIIAAIDKLQKKEPAVPKKMDEKAAAEVAKTIFQQHKNLSIVFITGDSQSFKDEGAAIKHAREKNIDYFKITK